MESCHSTSVPLLKTGARIALVGNPNVGKSLLFHRLTGRYVIVSNYPGTTVELSQGSAKEISQVTVVDTPGIIAFPPRTEDEEVTARVLLEEDFRAVLLVGDAKNFRRTMHLAIQMAEMEIPLVLAMNMIDEARARGVQIDYTRLSDILGLPVVPTVATRGAGVSDVERALSSARRSLYRMAYPPLLDKGLDELAEYVPSSSISARSLVLLWLSGDSLATKWLQEHMPEGEYSGLQFQRDQLAGKFEEPLPQIIQQSRDELVEKIAKEVLNQANIGRVSFASTLSRWSTHPLLGLPILALVLLGMYWFVGVFGAGTLVGLLENKFFGQILNPWLVDHVRLWIPLPLLSDFIVGEYGVWTMGMTYAVALLLPIVVTFFITFGLLEDSGYLPRLAVLSNRAFRKMGLNGKAVLPMVLGLGCVTMATMTTRILTSKRDRLLVIFLLALAVPCSAQLGVVLGMLAGISLSAAMIWGGVVMAVLMLVGGLAAHLMPGERTPLIVELPPLRMPVLSNVLMKTLARLEWYIKEAVPLFILGTVLLFTLDKLHILPWLIKAGEPLVSGWLGLPAQASAAFLIGFLRRDFAATGLYALQSQGLLTDLQVVVALVTITLFIPCVASTFMIVKERGTKTAVAMVVFIFPFAFFIGGLLQRLLVLLGWGA